MSASRNKPINRELLLNHGYGHKDDTTLYTSTNKVKTIAAPDEDRFIKDAIGTKLVALEDQSLDQVLASSNTTQYGGGYITLNHFEDTIVSPFFYGYQIPISTDFHGSPPNNGTERLVGFDEDGDQSTLNDKIAYFRAGRQSDAYYTPHDWMYIDHIDIGFKFSTITSDHNSNYFKVGIFAGSLPDETGMAYGVSKGWFSNAEVDTAENITAPFLEHDDGGRFHPIKGRLKQANGQAKRSEVFFVPISTTLTDYHDKYFYLTDGLGNRVKFILNKDSTSNSHMSITEWKIGISGCTTVAELCEEIFDGIKDACTITSVIPSSHGGDIRLFARDLTTKIGIYNLEPGIHGNTNIETNIADTILKITDATGTDTTNAFAEGVDYDPEARIIGDVTEPCSMYIRALDQRPDNTEDAGGVAQVPALDIRGEMNQGLTGAQHYSGRIANSAPIYFPDSLGLLNYFEVRCQINVKAIMRYKGTPIKAVLTYLGNPVDNRLDRAAGGDTLVQYIYTTARIYGGRI